MKFAEFRQRLGTWLATSPNAMWIKPALGALIGAIASYVATSDLHPLIIIICASVSPVIINSLNSQDPRVGIGKGSGWADLHDVFGTDDKDPSA